MISDKAVLVIIPCFNEAKSILSVLDEVKEQGHPLSPLIVDDGSTDRTNAVVKSASLTLRLHTNLGIGGAVQTGIQYALEHQYSSCVQLDGDGQHLASEINSLIKRQNETGADIVIGSRFLEVHSFRSTGPRRLGIACLKWLITRITHVPITDPTSGFRLLNRKAIELFSREYPLDFPEPVSLVLAIKSGLSISEVGVRMRERTYGHSSISGLKTISYLIRVSFNILLVCLRRSFS
jgi:glycosyltransferase involved in cell wall biosynthesis